MKKIIAIALALVMCLSIMSMVVFAASDKMTVKVTAPADWAECYVYSWEPDSFGGWPGTKLTADANGVYSFEMTAAVKGMVIGSGDGKPQTVDITDLTFNAGTEVTIAVGEAGADGKHAYTITAGGDSTPTDPTTAPTTAPTTDPTTTTAPSGNRTLIVKAPSSWTTVNAYTWEPADLGDFPGGALQKSGDSYKTTIKTSTVNLVVSGMKADGTRQQTGNIKLDANSKTVTITVKDDGTFSIAYDGVASTGGNRKPAAPTPQGNLSNYRVVGNAAWMGSWVADSNLGQMVDMGSGVYRKNFENVEPGSYELKITKDGKWDNAYGVNGQNFTFTVDQKCTITVDFKLNGDTGVIEVYGTGVPATADISMISIVILMALASVTAVVLVVNKKKFI